MTQTNFTVPQLCYIPGVSLITTI